MKYLFLAFGDEKRLEALSANERDAFENACLVNNDMLRQSGHLLATEDFQSNHTATTVRVSNGQVSVTDGPFVETNEQLIGLFFVNARDLNEALHVASTMPQARGGPIEVRPICHDWYPQSPDCGDAGQPESGPQPGLVLGTTFASMDGQLNLDEPGGDVRNFVYRTLPEWRRIRPGRADWMA